MSGRGKDCCSVCNNRVAKSARALQCMLCREWFHCVCAELNEDDYSFMSKRFKFGFRWSCDGCVGEVDSLMAEGRMTGRMDELKQDVTSMMAQHMQKLGERLDVMEGKCSAFAAGSQPPVLNVETPSFADVVRKTLQEGKESKVIVNDRGSEKTIENQDVLVLKPRSGNGIGSEIGGIKEALEEVQVSSCRKTKAGGLVIKFPNTKAKDEASRAIGAHLGPDTVVQVTEPRKMLPKMTLTDVSEGLADEEVVPSILKKNPSIQRLVTGGCSLSLVFTKTREHYKIAVLKMSPEIRSEIAKNSNYIYVGLGRCKAYDRFWVSQCFHCQGFGHKSSACPKKDATAVCAFCAGSHESRTCENKDSPQCTNCLSMETSSGPTNHFASSSNCPVMISQRKKIMENTNFTCSKNL